MSEANGVALNQDVPEGAQESNGGGYGQGGPRGDKRPKADPDVCRDFLNGICARGGRCRFRHPDDEGGKTEGIVPYTFCIDFQNRGCFRESCRFVHASSEDAERYQRKGIVSLSLARAIAATLTINDSINGIPVCKEFQTGSCSRGGNRCRYWHVNVDEEHAARQNMIRMGTAMAPPPGQIPFTPGMRRGPPTDYEFDHPPAKRGAFGPRMPLHPGMGMEPGGTSPYISSIERRNAELEKENETLRRELDREKHRYEDLMALFKQSQGAHHPAAGAHHPAPGPVPPPQNEYYSGAQGYHSQHWG